MNKLGNFTKDDVVDFEFPMNDYVASNKVFGVYTSLNSDNLYEKSWDMIIGENKDEFSFRYSYPTSDGYECRCLMFAELSDGKMKGIATEFTHIKYQHEFTPAEDSGRGVDSYFMLRMISDISNEMGNGVTKIYLDKGAKEFTLPSKSNYHDCMATAKLLNEYIFSKNRKQVIDLTPDQKSDVKTKSKNRG